MREFLNFYYDGMNASYVLELWQGVTKPQWNKCMTFNVLTSYLLQQMAPCFVLQLTTDHQEHNQAQLYCNVQQCVV